MSEAMLDEQLRRVEAIWPIGLTGSVVRTHGATVAVAGFPAPLGAVVEIQRPPMAACPAEVIGFHEGSTIVYPMGDLVGVRQGSRVRMVRTRRLVPVGPALLGRVIDAHGHPLDRGPRPASRRSVPLDAKPPAACDRARIDRPFTTGVRAIDGLLTCGRGQRMGIFSGAGVGKSVTLGMMARYSSADVNVIGLIGERGREVNEFVQRDLGPDGLARSVVIVATSDQSALLRVQAAMAATAIAEYFRDQGLDVLLMMDSLTRFALAQREIGLSAGEPPTTRGYPPSVFAMLPSLVERAGCGTQGSITAFYSVLMEGDDTTEPISDTVRGLLDGHAILSRPLASRGHYPAIDVLDSVSRLMTQIADREHQDAAAVVRDLLAVHRQNEDLVSIGAYQPGGNRRLDAALALEDELNAFLRQAIDQPAMPDETRCELLRLAEKCRAAIARAAPRGP